jgi:hypothetical protein
MAELFASFLIVLPIKQRIGLYTNADGPSNISFFLLLHRAFSFGRSNTRRWYVSLSRTTGPCTALTGERDHSQAQNLSTPILRRARSTSGSLAPWQVHHAAVYLSKQSTRSLASISENMRQ